MGLKIKTKLIDASLRKVQKRLDNLKRPMTPLDSRQLGRAVVKEMRALSSKGISPIKGDGRFPAYRGSYKKQIQEKGRLSGFSKRLRPVNLKLSGEFLKALKSKIKRIKQNSVVVVGFFDKKNALKEKGHREGANKQRKRPIIPEPPEQFAQRIQDVILQFANRATNKQIKKKL